MNIQEAKIFLDDFRADRNFKRVVAYVLETKGTATLVELMELGRYPYAEHSSWVLMHVSDAQPSVFEPYREKVEEIAFSSANNTLQRNMLYVLLNMEVPAEPESQRFDQLMELMMRQDIKPAVKVNALKLTERWFLKSYPELVPEVKLVLDILKEDEQPSIRVMLRNFNLKWK